ncbi:unnamed protein product, partial [Ectocarpus sp. 4 AP-2014]
ILSERSITPRRRTPKTEVLWICGVFRKGGVFRKKKKGGGFRQDLGEMSSTSSPLSLFFLGAV